MIQRLLLALSFGFLASGQMDRCPDHWFEAHGMQLGCLFFGHPNEEVTHEEAKSFCADKQEGVTYTYFNDKLFKCAINNLTLMRTSRFIDTEMKKDEHPVPVADFRWTAVTLDIIY